MAEYVKIALNQDARTPAEKWVDHAVDSRYGFEMGSEPYPILRSVAVDLVMQRDELAKALREMCAEFRALDLPYGSDAYNMANTALNNIFPK